MRGLTEVFPRVMQSAMRLVGRDMTAAETGRSCLVLVPHLGDAVEGCGATILRKRDAGTVVWLVSVLGGTDVVGHASLEVAGEGPAAGAGGPEGSGPGGADDPAAPGGAVPGGESSVDGGPAHFLGLDAGAVSGLALSASALSGPNKLPTAIADLLERHRPDELLTVSASDPDPRAAAVGAAARLAVQRHRSAGSPIELLTFPVGQWQHPASFVASLLLAGRPRLVSTEGYRSRKQDARSTVPPRAPAGANDPMAGRWEVLLPIAVGQEGNPPAGFRPRLLNVLRDVRDIVRPHRPPV